jgi:hypothetical protein
MDGNMEESEINLHNLSTEGHTIYIHLQFLNIFRCKRTEEDIDIGFTPGHSSTPEKESGKQ